MLVTDFDYVLPAELIAQEPLPVRSDSRMLHIDRATGKYEDGVFRHFPQMLHPDDVVIFNDTRVFPARLYGHKIQGPAGRIEVLLTRQVSNDPNEWECLVRPGRKIGVGVSLHFGEHGELEAEVVGSGAFGQRTLRFASVADFFDLLERIGRMPLPPYIGREDRSADRDRYQTVFARHVGSIAAPTAGLHFTPEILAGIEARGSQTAQITLHVGLGTFQPIRVKHIEDHSLHCEYYAISPETAGIINSAKKENRRVIAIGTTTVRALEHCASLSSSAAGSGSEICPGQREADIFIYPGYRFRVVDGLLTNFHLPQSSLLLLVSAFAGRESVLNAYRHAVEKKYRFYSYGDCMFLD